MILFFTSLLYSHSHSLNKVTVLVIFLECEVMDFQAPELLHQSNPQTDVYLKYYQAQVGGTLPVFRGAKYYSQSGAGIGDFFRGLFRHVVPIALQGVSAFLGQTLKSRDTGANWKESNRLLLQPLEMYWRMQQLL